MVRKTPPQVPNICTPGNWVSGLASAADGHVLSWAGLWQALVRELSWAPAQLGPAARAVQWSTGGAASPSASGSGALRGLVGETHVLPAVQGSSALSTF